MRSKHRTDANHSEIINAFESLGCSVVDLSATAGAAVRNIGVADLLVGIAGVNELVENKVEKGKFSVSQIAFNQRWRGAQPHKVASVDDVIRLVQKIRTSVKNGITRNVSNVE